MAKDSKRSKKSVASTKSATKPPAGAAKSAASKSGAAKSPAKTSSKRVSPAVAPMKVTRPAPSKAAAGMSHEMSHDERMAKIAEAAYYMAERRHFAPGGELQDWLAAERAVDGN